MPRFGAVLARLFTLQGSWNYERMQGIGFGNAAEPALRSLEPGARSIAVARETQFFNAHPYFAGLAVGAAVRAELDGEAPERIARLREALCGPLGSIGDRLFWAAWLPLCSAVALIALALGAGAWSVVLFLALYNVAHVACRVWALRAGWQRGMQVAAALGSPLLRRFNQAAAPLTGLVVGMAIPLMLAREMHAEGVGDAARAGAAGGAIVVCLLLRLARSAGGVLIPAVVLGAATVAGMFLW